MTFYGFRMAFRRVVGMAQSDIERQRKKVSQGGGLVRLKHPRGWLSLLFVAGALGTLFLPNDCVLREISGVIVAVAFFAGIYRDVVIKKGRKRWFFLLVMSLTLGATFAVMCMIFLFGAETPDKEMFVWFAPSSAALLLFSLLSWRRYRRLRSEAEIRLWALRQERKRKMSG